MVVAWLSDTVASFGWGPLAGTRGCHHYQKAQQMSLAWLFQKPRDRQRET